MKTLDPFSFWPNYSSSMQGFGGPDSSPDPFYCFHTTYHEFEPGLVNFNVHFSGVRASKGELEFRVNGYRADAGMDAVLVAGGRVSLENAEDIVDVPLSIAALPGVTYAIFCRHTEPSDFSIEGIVITAEELGDDDLSAYATRHVGTSRYGSPRIDQPSLLITIGEPSLAFPCSQPMTSSQLSEEDFWRTAPSVIAEMPDPADRWRSAYAFQALRVYGYLSHGATGLLNMAHDTPLDALLNNYGCLCAALEPGQATGPIDFAIEMHTTLDDSAPDLSAYVLRAIRSVSRGGLGIFTFDYHPEALEAHPVVPDQQMIQRAALRIIGHGCDVAQLNFPSSRDMQDELYGATVPFGLIVRC